MKEQSRRSFLGNLGLIGAGAVITPKILGCDDTGEGPGGTVGSVETTFFNEKTKWISYAPTNFNPNWSQFPSETSVRADLQVLVNSGFKGIVTYGSDNILGSVPRYAKEEGFDHVVMGIWSPTSTGEWNNAVNMSNQVSGYCLGNEGLLTERYNLADLETKMDQLRSATGKPVTTTEPVTSYDSALLQVGDWVFVNAHPYWNGVSDPVAAANWTNDQYNALRSEMDSLGLTDKVLVLKEVGLPTAGEAGLSEANQKQYYNTLETLTTANPKTAFSYFEAFDQPWKDWGVVEPHWGIFNQDRSPKEITTAKVNVDQRKILAKDTDYVNLG